MEVEREKSSSELRWREEKKAAVDVWMKEYAEFVCFAPGWFGVKVEEEAITWVGRTGLLERVSKSPKSRFHIPLIRSRKEAMQR